MICCKKMMVQLCLLLYRYSNAMYYFAHLAELFLLKTILLPLPLHTVTVEGEKSRALYTSRLGLAHRRGDDMHDLLHDFSREPFFPRRRDFQVR